MGDKPLEIFLFKSCNAAVCTQAYSELLNKSRILSKAVCSVVGALRGAEVNVIVVDGRAIRGLNERFRNQDRSTDVLSFPIDGSILGEVWICPSVIVENAKLANEDFERELLRVVVHGLLHLAGYDHKSHYTDYTEKSTEKMFELQEKILSRI
ncbi:MAG: rRNA maturation RNase YbeY [Patescibacteria group bacterium]|nr:rRNA maturation RNase YbeY [Patescibacteria group bacterium]